MDDIKKDIGIKRMNKLTPKKRVLLGKPSVPWLLKKFHVFFVSQRFVTLLSTAPPYIPTLSPINSVQSLQHFFKRHFNIAFLRMPTTCK
jgi:hypothetical protein